jgi:hypothetical protein
MPGNHTVIQVLLGPVLEKLMDAGSTLRASALITAVVLMFPMGRLNRQIEILVPLP